MRPERGRFQPFAGLPVHLRSPARNANKWLRRRWNAPGPGSEEPTFDVGETVPVSASIDAACGISGSPYGGGAHVPMERQDDVPGAERLARDFADDFRLLEDLG